MTSRRTLGCPLALGAILFAAALAPVAVASPSAPALLAGVQRLNGELALMGRGSGALGTAGGRAISELRFVNRDGYTISVIAFGQTVGLSVSRTKLRAQSSGDGGQKVRERASTTTYLVHGKVTSSSIEASFGDRGRIAVRFRPTGRAVHATDKAGCRRPGRGSLATLGVFTGELSFEGEGGYTSAEVHRARGRSIDLAALLACLLGGSPNGQATLPRAQAPLGIRLPGLVAGRAEASPSTPSVPTHPSTGPESTTLVADSKLALARTVFAAQMRGKGAPRFLAVEEASEGSIGVVRLAFARGTGGDFVADDALSSGTVAPPAPFAGTGALRRGSGNTKSWTGPLRVSFLGAPHVPLTGEPFGVWLSRGF
jgi:hypothetical protein